MKICYLMSSFEGGGASATLEQLLRLIKERGHEVEVVACEGRDAKIVEEVRKANVGWRVLGGGTTGKPGKILFFLCYLLRHRPDLIWTSHSKGSFVGQAAGKLLGIPVVSWKNLASSRRYSRLLAKVPKLWLADSNAVAQALQRDLNIPEDKIALWPLFECAGQPLPGGHTPGQNMGHRPLRVGTLGRLHSVKNYDLLLRAVAHLKLTYLKQPSLPLSQRLVVLIAGDGPEQQNLKNLARELDVEDIVKFEGFLPQIRPFLDSLDVYIQPSRNEGLCLSVHEAMSRGLPVIATPVGDIPSVVKTGETGILLETPEEEKCLKSCVAALNFFLDHPEHCASLGRAGQRVVTEKYPPHSFYQTGTQVLERVERLLKTTQK